MNPHYKRYTDYLVALGIEKVPHTEKTYLGHLVNVYRLMEAQHCEEDVCVAGMFHSIYGTEKFQGFKLPVDDRPKLREFIGARAERLAYFNCAMDRATFDAVLDQPEGPYRFVDRITKEPIELAKAEFDDLCRVHLYDWLEQAPRSQYGMDYRKTAYRKMAERVGGVAAWERVFLAEAEALAK